MGLWEDINTYVRLYSLSVQYVYLDIHQAGLPKILNVSFMERNVCMKKKVV